MLRPPPSPARLPIVLLAASSLLPAAAGAQPSASADAVVVLPAAAGAAARAGATTVFGEGPFDALDQPALLATRRHLVLETSWQIDRFVDPAVDPWAVGVVVPLGDAGAELPVLTVSHRRLRGEDLALPGASRLVYDVDHDLTSFGLGWQTPGGRLALGAALHATSKSGVTRFALRTALGDTSTVPDGHDDLLFSTTVGALLRSEPRTVGGGEFTARSGLALRRWGEDVDVTSASLPDGNGGQVVLTRRSALGATAALGVGADWSAPDVAVRCALDLSWPLHDAASESATLAAALELTLFDLLSLRSGVRDDTRGTDLTFGAGLRSPPWRGARVAVDVAREPARSDLAMAEDATIVSVGLHFGLGAPPPEDDLDELFDDLDRLDDWIDEVPASSDSTTTPAPEIGP